MISKAKLTTLEIEQVMDFIHSTPNIIFYSAHELSDLVAYKFYIDSKMVGFCLIKSIGWSQNWLEIAILGVLDEYQGQGIGSQLFKKALVDMYSDGKLVYTTTTNPKVQKMMIDEGFEVLNNTWQLPIEITWDNLGYILNMPRIREFLRKRKVFGPNKFVYGILTK
jgi:GNAT superfamily N-acetyltransferase